MKKLAIQLAATLTILTIGVLTLAPAAAHIPTVAATCEAGVTVVLTDYAENNTLAVTIDDRTVTQGFAGQLAYTLPNPDKTVSHTWRVVVDSSVGEGSLDQSGTIPACMSPPTTTTTPPPTPKQPAPPVAVKAPPRTAG